MPPETEDKDDFLDAIKADKYAELEVMDNYYLITDWEGDGAYCPYVVADRNVSGDERNHDSLEQQLADTIASLFGCRVYNVRYGSDSRELDLFDVSMKRPTDD